MKRVYPPVKQKNSPPNGVNTLKFYWEPCFMILFRISSSFYFFHWLRSILQFGKQKSHGITVDDSKSCQNFHYQQRTVWWCRVMVKNPVNQSQTMCCCLRFQRALCKMFPFWMVGTVLVQIVSHKGKAPYIGWRWVVSFIIESFYLQYPLDTWLSCPWSQSWTWTKRKILLILGTESQSFSLYSITLLSHPTS